MHQLKLKTIGLTQLFEIIIQNFRFKPFKLLTLRPAGTHCFGCIEPESAEIKR